MERSFVLRIIYKLEKSRKKMAVRNDGRWWVRFEDMAEQFSRRECVRLDGMGSQCEVTDDKFCISPFTL